MPAKKYTLVISKKAEKELYKLPNDISKRITTAINELCNNPRPKGYRKMMGQRGYRIRKGDYRIIYEIEDDKIIITVLNVGHRRDIYDRI